MKTKLNKLLEQVSYGLIDTDIQNINELLDYGEFGTALELICGQLYEHNSHVTDIVLKDIIELAESMKMKASTWDFLEVSENGLVINNESTDNICTLDFVRKQLTNGVSDFLIIALLRSDYNFTYDDALKYLESIKNSYY